MLQRMPDEGRTRSEILDELRAVAGAEDEAWKDGSCSGTMYSGDVDHYAFTSEVFGEFGHHNVLHRDLCKSATRFETEILKMTLDMLGANEMPEGSDPVGLITSGGTGSILHAMLAYRERGRANGITQPNIVRPETAHPAFDKAAFLLGMELREVPVDPETTTVDPEAMAAQVDANTVSLIASAGNYPYGTIDPIPALGQIALEHGIGLHIDGCLGGFILPWGRKLGRDIAPFDLSVPGVSSISADTHKYGYAPKGTSVVVFNDRSLRDLVYFFRPGWTGGKYYSPGIDGSRSGGLIAACWATMVSLGRDGYMERAERIFDVAAEMIEHVEAHPQLRTMGNPTFCFSFTSDELDIYLLNDHLVSKGWRLNGQQYPDAIHMAVTGPQTQPGVADRFGRDLAEAVDYAIAHAGEAATSASFYGGVPGGLTPESDAMIRDFMTDFIDSTIGETRSRS